MSKLIYGFNEGSKEMKALLGSKGANLGEMTKIGLNVPPGFTLSTESCKSFYQHEQNLSNELIDELKRHLASLEEKTGKGFGSYVNPLLVSVRSGAAISMPGMMDTILNLGLNDETVKSLAEKTQNGRFAYDSYRRFIMMFSEIASGIPRYKFERLLEKRKAEKGVESDLELSEQDMKDLSADFKEIYLRETHTAFPQEPFTQLISAIKAVFNSWNNPRAVIYRKLNHIPEDLGTAVTVQMMVFGNTGHESGTGVLFTRHPATGEKALFGEFLLNAQGEDVVSGVRTPSSISQLKSLLPSVYMELEKVAGILEVRFKDMQDIEFTVENKNLYILQTRTGKRSAKAAVNIAADLVKEGKISKAQAILRVTPETLNQLLHPHFDVKAVQDAMVISKGLAASPGAASGKVIFTPDIPDDDNQYILVRTDTSPEDIEGMVKAEGILTSRGGMTSHAAVVARGMGKTCVCGCTDIVIDEENKLFKAGNLVIREGDVISVDGTNGSVYQGIIPKNAVDLGGNFALFMSWVDEIRVLKVYANAETPPDALMAVRYGAEGIGLCRTEHMFFAQDRIMLIRKMIMAETKARREAALNDLLEIQKSDFTEIFKILKDRPCTIRLLDPPLHEFLPKTVSDMQVMAEYLKLSKTDVIRRVEELSEVNPMLGHRGCRLAVTYPEIYIMQVKAIFQSAIELKKIGLDVVPEIMIPLIGDIKELKYIKSYLKDVIQTLFDEHGLVIPYTLGTMIEVPRSALIADEISPEVDFFSFGTNDLTQMTYGFSRDDAFRFLKEYKNKQLIENDPFEVLDEDGVGRLIQTAKNLGRIGNSKLKLGVCGEHGGEPKSIQFFNKLGLDYVSCSPFRVPVARLAAAQAELFRKGDIYE